MYNFDEIYVYEPCGQSEHIDKPELILKLPVSRPGLRGHIDPRHPHGVNHLVLDRLGHEEIVLVACDDGDVMAYYVSDIQRELVSRGFSDTSFIPAPNDHSLRPFFLQNVGLSAWGLAVHTNARQVAVSCNTGIVHVFAFGLVDSEYPRGLGQHISSTQWPVVSHLTRHEVPAQNWHIELKGHENNVPTVAFDNSGRDPEGRYLVSAEIGQNGIIWDLWDKNIDSFFAHGTFVGWNNNEEPPELLARNWGWSVLCVDPASYWPSQGCQETFGCSEPYLWKQNSRQWDNTPSAAIVPNNVPGRAFRALVYGNEDEEVCRDKGNVLTDADLVKAARSDIECMKGKRVDAMADLRDIYSIRSTRTARLQSGKLHHLKNSDFSDNFDNSCTSDTPDSANDEVSYEGLSILNPEYRQRPQFDILVCTSRDIGLIYRSGPNPLDRINCSDPLSCQKPLPGCNVHAYHRLNMATQIRELGIIIVGDQAGRVAVISLTKMRNAPRIKGFRIDRILPTWSEEKAGHRPRTALVGMALGPVSPGQDEGIDRTWRLMLFYYDHTILVYHIKRKFSRGRFGDSKGE